MFGYLLPNGTYYECDVQPSEEFLKEFPQEEGTISVPRRPESYYDWDATDEEWVLNVSERDNVLSELNRAKREEILRKKVDPLVTNPLRWASLTSAYQTQVENYRQALLDITNQAEWPITVSWPTAPEGLELEEYDA